MSIDCYYGAYARFDTVSKRDAAVLIGSDCIVGDTFDIQFRPYKGSTRAWIVNAFDTDIGFLDEKTSHHLNVLAAREWTLHAILSCVAFTDQPEPGMYWGEVALLCYDRSHESDFDTFVTETAKLIGKGIRPKVDLETQGIVSIIQSHGTWQPKQRVPFPGTNKNTAIIKKSRGALDFLVQKSREGNKGCYVLSWLFLLGLVALVVFALKGCGVF